MNEKEVRNIFPKQAARLDEIAKNRQELYNIQLYQFQKLISDSICKISQEMGLHYYDDVKKVVIKAIEELEMRW